MSLEIEGKIVQVMPKQTGNSANGSWEKQEFVIETSGNYPKKVCFSVWGDKTSIVSGLKDGQAVKVSFEPSSREYNQKWYTDLRAWKVETGGSGATTKRNSPPPPTLDDAPPEQDEDGMPF